MVLFHYSLHYWDSGDPAVKHVGLEIGKEDQLRSKQGFPRDYQTRGGSDSDTGSREGTWQKEIRCDDDDDPCSLRLLTLVLSPSSLIFFLVPTWMADGRDGEMERERDSRERFERFGEILDGGSIRANTQSPFSLCQENSD